MKSILIIGATSAIAQETATLFASEGVPIFLVGRDRARLDIQAEDLRTKGAPKVSTFELDLTSHQRHGEMLSEAERFLGGLDGVLVAYGHLPDQQACEGDVQLTRTVFDVNCLSVISLLTLLANYFEQAGSGRLAVISSVAGDRGKQKNYVYGSTKAAVSTFMEGLRGRLHAHGVTVLTVKPGLVDTPMTAHLEKNRLFVSPRSVAVSIFKSMQGRKTEVYTPGYWRWVMLVLRHMPEPLFRKFKL